MLAHDGGRSQTGLRKKKQNKKHCAKPCVTQQQQQTMYAVSLNSKD
jgi:hypothetical protein